MHNFFVELSTYLLYIRLNSYKWINLMEKYLLRFMQNCADWRSAEEKKSIFVRNQALVISVALHLNCEVILFYFDWEFSHLLCAASHTKDNKKFMCSAYAAHITITKEFSHIFFSLSFTRSDFTHSVRKKRKEKENGSPVPDCNLMQCIVSKQIGNSSINKIDV